MQKINDSQNKENVVFLATGGHAGTTALAVINEIKKYNPTWKLHWIGAKYAVEGKKLLTIEAKTMPNINVTFHGLTAGKIQRRWSRFTLLSIAKIPIGFIQAFILIIRIKPDVVVSFGGFAGFPVVFMSYLLRKPVILQEQITGLGFANRMSLPFARKVALARIQGLEFARGKGIVVGNPVNPGITQLKRKVKMHVSPAIFVFAGSRGSQIINVVIEKLLPKLLGKYTVYHHAGLLDYDKFMKLRVNLPKDKQDNYHVYDFIDPKKVPEFYEKSDILIGRAGANTVSELMIVGIPSILIPLTWTNYQEQVLNAKEAQKRNIAKIILPNDLTLGKLEETIGLVTENWHHMVKNQLRDLADLDAKASEKLVKLIVEEVR